MTWRATVILLAALALADCGSSPKTHYFTLAAVPGAAHERHAIATPVTVAAVHVPPALDRRSMVSRTGANSVEISDQDRWTAPLGDMVRDVLSQDLAARLPADKVILPAAPMPPHTARIIVSLAQFGPEADGRVTLDGSWALLEGGSATPVQHRDIALTTTASARIGNAQAAAMSQLLGELADHIAATLGRSRR